jgi:hypothetical protein
LLYTFLKKVLIFILFPKKYKASITLFILFLKV